MYGQYKSFDSMYALTESIRFLFDLHPGKKRVFRKYVIPNLSGKKVLDFGCGAGFYTREYAKVASSVTGVDRSLASLDLAKSMDPEGIIKYQSLEEDTDATYDAIICSDSLEFNPDWNTYLESLWGCLEEGGSLYISCPNFTLKKSLMPSLLIRIEGMVVRLFSSSSGKASHVVSSLEGGKWHGTYYRPFTQELEVWLLEKGISFDKRLFFLGSRLPFNSPSGNHVLYTVRKVTPLLPY